MKKLSEWLEKLNTAKKSEAIETLKAEGVSRETYVAFKDRSGTDYLVGISEFSSPPFVSDGSNPLDEEHAKLKKECLELVAPGTVLLDLHTNELT